MSRLKAYFALLLTVLSITVLAQEDCPPSNDVCASAIELDVANFFYDGDLCCATASGEPNFAVGDETAYDVWFKLNVQDFETFTFELNNVSLPEVGIMVYSGDCNGLVEETGCVVSTQCAADLGDFITIQPNTDYYFAVFKTDPDACGSFTLGGQGHIYGCTDPWTCNYDPEATLDDASCQYDLGCAVFQDTCQYAYHLQCGQTTYGNTLGASDFGSDEPIPGCDDIMGKGVWFDFVGTGSLTTFSLCGSYIDSKMFLLEGNCADGFECLDYNYDNFDFCGFFEQDDAAITYPCEAGTLYYIFVGSEYDNNPNTQDEGAMLLSVECETLNVGCTDPTANNYDPAATEDDGSCLYGILGCTDDTACNYLPVADFDDGSCLYGAECADLDGDGEVDANDLLTFIAAFGQTGDSVADFNNDQIVNATDLIIFLSSFT